ncbi:SDR family NAD(P)-dependent oxidoreductase [Skermania sp. ID1734]|uniref:short-chain dehydrogenase/reductase n=1 Tax=Skermania sp. ID1734 TaxID=2597516 RepID=UPI00117E6AF8|nr:short-chain dehydrogenase/reductase [Skermania sp. ID1734]TSD93250.1 SDR family NAD(P)-dependent oxidoreductase [Skermania sp. ID1734]
MDLLTDLKHLLPGLGHRPRYELSGTVALVTGAADGIGLAVAHALRRRGAKVAAVDIDADKLAATASGRPETLPIAADVRDRAAMNQAVESTVAHFGHLDIVIANAGITPPPATVRSIHPEAFDNVIDVNLTGAFNTIHPALDHIIAARGHVVVVASCAAFSPGAGGAAYMISKAGAEQLGRALRLELAPHGASATTAYFGIVDTQLTHTALDNDPLGPSLEASLPAPFRHRITADDAARTIVDGIERRAARTIAPAIWQTYALTRGIINPAIDHYLASHPDLHRLITDIETRSLKTPPATDRPHTEETS